MDKKEQIFHYHRIDGLSLREISRRVGLNRKTVTRYIREYEAQVSSDPEEGADMCLAIRPKYPLRKVERSKPKEVFIKQYYEPGEECEFDWGEVKLRIAAKQVAFTMAVFALCHSEGRWAYLFRHQATESLPRMEAFYGFSHRFCNARAGWEKVLKDKVLCSALVDRLRHKSYLVNMTGTSYRIKETRKIINNK